MMEIISQCICTSNHHVVYFRYIKICQLHLNKVKKKQKDGGKRQKRERRGKNKYNKGNTRLHGVLLKDAIYRG